MFPLIITCFWIQQGILVTISKKSYLKNTFCQILFWALQIPSVFNSKFNYHLKYRLLGENSKTRFQKIPIKSPESVLRSLLQNPFPTTNDGPIKLRFLGMSSLPFMTLVMPKASSKLPRSRGARQVLYGRFDAT